MTQEEIERVANSADCLKGWDDLPVIRKTGRYAFFAACAFGLSGMVGAGLAAIGFTRDMSLIAAQVSALASFLALREMSKPWDAVLQARAAALRARAKDAE